jgi:hypothetical protein
MPRCSGARRLRWHFSGCLQLHGRAFDSAVVNVMVTAFDNTLRETKQQT